MSGAVFSTDAWGDTPFPTLPRNRCFGSGHLGDSGRRFRSEGFSRNRRDRFENNQGVTVIYPGYGDYNNSNYLGYPPWYRLNYYTPWMSDYENGTAWQNIPSSHAEIGYGSPMGYSNAPADTAAQAAGPNAPADAANVDYVVAVQRELRRRGFYRGVVNGVSDAPTRAAIRAYESSIGLPVTGIIGFPLLRTLGFF